MGHVTGSGMVSCASDALELFLAKLLLWLSSKRDDGIAVEAATDDDGSILGEGRRAFRIVNGLAPQLLAVADAYRQDKTRIPHGFTVRTFDGPRANDYYVSQDGGGRFDVQRGFHSPVQLSCSCFETKK